MKMTRYGLSAALAVALGWSNSAYAVPTLQLGLCLDNPVSSSCSTYRANQDIGGDEDTAFTTSDPFTLSIGVCSPKMRWCNLARYTATEVA